MKCVRNVVRFLREGVKNLWARIQGLFTKMTEKLLSKRIIFRRVPGLGNIGRFFIMRSYEIIRF